MYKLLILSALVACAYASEEPCVGCSYEDNSNNDDVLPDLEKVVQQANIGEEVETVEHVEKEEPCVGCSYEDNSNNDDVLPDLKKVVQQANIGEEVKTVEHVQKQVVNGVLYTVLFISESGKYCDASWVSRPWVSEQPQESKVECQ